ncbi:hypothetical protein ABNB59_07520 [Paenibacillus larvae]|uniref:Uncharacterized protein n=3 Tax=Paenibacillus larvae TaxID=1464 RepID=V9WC17_9BACL|nr:hypothetical protein [Paenibacillus larvae]AHD07394.1 hypothetical protein ERIC2_c36770 [Paenibacillus larvae subsp. larvae DSM 25430]AQR79140.1 hypothetical protein BXP28_19850 [Paenibacillus larvae subsp. larvae]AVF23735.1 hypothetical protein ERICI_04005 [Paenibacillus larvae subsp. larvae]AVG13957.1 hypothetical protein ERICII_03665 [Paenibacillus larvae subsp. larvae DSM 25430]ETK29597.1 hypothetical protein ERIC1_1c31540 [Paenibacillus larvae subsp. larvae DSM 25719]
MLLYQMIRMLEDKTALDIAIREQNGDGDALMREKARLEEQIRKQASRWQSEFADSDLGAEDGLLTVPELDPYTPV